MNMKENFKGKKSIIIVVFVIIVIAAFFIVQNKNNIYKNNNVVHIYYRTHSNGKWTNWKKDGKTSGNMKDNIDNIEFKYKFKKGNDLLSYSVYSKKWSIDYTPGDNMKNTTINGIMIDNYDVLSKRFYICYRTYNKNNKWLNWSCNGEANGNAKYNIKAIEVKFVPRNSVLSDYLKDYSDSKISNFNF